MRVAGIDLSSEPRRTGIAVLEVERDIRVVDLGLEPRIGPVSTVVERVAVAGIDAPFGWPDEFVEAISSHHRHGTWNGGSTPEERRLLRYRATDRHARASSLGRWPLSVSSDLIAVPAMRCAALLDRLAESGVEIDRSGMTGRVVEAYPAAALAEWGLRKRLEPVELPDLADTLTAKLAIRMTPEQRQELRSCRDCFDALVAALVALAARRGLTREPPPELVKRARREGWIHIPVPQSLDRLP